MNFKKYVSNSFEETLSVQDKINWSVESLRCIDFTIFLKRNPLTLVMG